MQRALLIVIVSLAGCSSTPKPAADYGPPDDFALSMTIQGQGTDKALSPAWYVVDADGVLRAGLGERSPGTPLPPIARQLAFADLRDLWSTLRSAGLSPRGARAGRDAEPGQPSVRAGAQEAPLVVSTSTAPMAVVYVAAEGRRRTFEVDLTQQDRAAQATRDIATRLRELAGIRQTMP